MRKACQPEGSFFFTIRCGSCNEYDMIRCGSCNEYGKARELYFLPACGMDIRKCHETLLLDVTLMPLEMELLTIEPG